MNDKQRSMHVARVSKEAQGKMLCHAYAIIVKREGLQLRVYSLNGRHVVLADASNDDRSRINVAVNGSIVTNSWIG
jgi:hypothetical protein